MHILKNNKLECVPGNTITYRDYAHFFINRDQMNILIFGASGATGHQLVNLALVQGHSVTAFVRDPLKLKTRHANLKIVKGDILDHQLVDEVVRNHDAVFSALGASSPFKYDESIVTGINNIINAMEKHNVQRFIYLSFVGVKQTRSHAGFVIKHIAPKILTTEIAGHEAREKRIQDSSLQWTIVRPPTLTNGRHKTRFRSGETISKKGFIVKISRADVADFMLQQLEADTFVRKKPVVMY